MLDMALNWLRSDLNLFTKLGSHFEIMESPERADIGSVTADFELNNYFCRLIFWESGSAHIEVIEIDSEKTFLDEAFDFEVELLKKEPFKEYADRLSG